MYDQVTTQQWTTALAGTVSSSPNGYFITPAIIDNPPEEETPTRVKVGVKFSVDDGTPFRACVKRPRAARRREKMETVWVDTVSITV